MMRHPLVSYILGSSDLLVCLAAEKENEATEFMEKMCEAAGDFEPSGIWTDAHRAKVPLCVYNSQRQSVDFANGGSVRPVSIQSRERLGCGRMFDRTYLLGDLDPTGDSEFLRLLRYATKGGDLSVAPPFLTRPQLNEMRTGERNE